MYKRDFGILVLTVFAVYFALQNEGSFIFRKAWYFRLTPDRFRIGSLYETLPKPVVIDLNGDGSLEIVAVTHDHRLVVIKGRGVGREDGFVKAQLMAEVSLRPSGFHVLSGQAPVALAAGYLEEPSKDLVHRPRKAVIVVMTENWRITCFDHNLVPLWTQDIRKEMHRHARIYEAAILITHHKIYDKDRGMVIIGGSMNILADMEEDPNVDPFETEIQEEKREEAMRQRLGEEEAKNEDQEGEIEGADISRHFSYYAFDGATGTMRWQNSGTDFKRDLHLLKDDLMPQRYYKLTPSFVLTLLFCRTEAEHLNAKDFSEVSCREYRESILHNLPHQWHQRHDTQFKLAHFSKHRSGKGERKKELATKERSASKPCIGVKCGSTAAVKAIGTVTNIATKDGKNVQKDLRPPNTIVAHLMEGIEAIHLYSGRTLCKLYLPEGGLHVDLNGDGVLDHIQVTASGEHHLGLPRCHAYATSGIPPTEPYFNGSICRNAWMNAFTAVQDPHLRQRRDALDFAPPAMLPLPTPRGEAAFRYGQRGMALFLNNQGDVTAFNARGRLKWQVSLDTTWNEGPGVPDARPTLKPLPLRVHAIPTAILVAGSGHAEVLSEHGNSLTQFLLPDAPNVPLEIVDLNADQLNDVLLVTQGAIYAYIQVPNLGGRPFAMLVMCLIVAMGTIYAAQYVNQEPTQKIKRSTDRAD